MGLARTLRAKERKRLAIVKVAFSGTSLFTDWNPRDAGDAGACYRALIKETKAAFAAAHEKKLEMRLRAFAWLQGESDANASRAPVYEKALAEMIAALRKDLESPQMLILLAVNTKFGGDKNVFMPKIVEAQKAVASKDTRCVYVDTASAATANTAHFSSAGTLDVGRRMAEALLKLEKQLSASASSEPTNVKEALAKKGAEDAIINEKFATWKATLSLDQQAWEGLLEANLGAFYLPIYKGDKVAGRTTAWDYVKDDPKLPRILLIGDSISRGYTLSARNALKGKANVHRAPENCGPVSNGLKKLDVWLGTGKWDIIHFNFGIHDRATPLADYERRLEDFVVRLKKSDATIVWASTTPVPLDTKDGAKLPAAIAERNEIAGKVMKKHNVVINDLFAFLTPHLAKVANSKDVHFNAEGYELLGKRVAEVLVTELKPK